jgi:parallel beta-helix repeat protein
MLKILLLFAFAQPPHSTLLKPFLKAKLFLGVCLFLWVNLLITGYVDAQLQNGLVGYWSFNEGIGTTASDSSGNGNTGALLNGPTWSAGKVGQALSFDGSNDSVEVPHGQSLNLSTALTVSVWINNETLMDPGLSQDQFRIIASKGWATDGGSWTLAWRENDGALFFFVGRDTSYRYARFSYDNSQAGTWHLITAVLANGNISLYQDGVLKAGPSGIDSNSVRTDTNPLRIGSLGWTSSSLRNWDGLLDEIRVYNRALSGSEIVSLYNQDNSAPFNFSLSNSMSLSATQGSSATNTITATLVSGSPQPVSLSVSGLPTGASGSFSQTTCNTTCSSLLTIATAATTPVGTYLFSVKGAAGGMVQSTNVTLKIDSIVQNNNAGVVAQTLTMAAATTPADSVTSTSAKRKSYYVTTSGNDANPGTESQPFRTLNRAVKLLRPGDVLYVKSGTYEESLFNAIPGGKSWRRPVTVAAYPGHSVTIRPKAGSSRVLHFEGVEKKYIVVDGFILDAVNVSHDAIKITYGNPRDAASRIRIRNSEVKNAPRQGILVTEGSDGNEFSNLRVHHNGTTDHDHGLYIGSDSNLIEGCQVYSHFGYGIHVYNATSEKPDSNTVKGNTVHDNQQTGIGVFGGSNNNVYNNLIYKNNNVGITTKSPGSHIYNNTLYNNREIGIYVETSDAIIANNISSRNAGFGIYIGPSSSNIRINNNLLSGNTNSNLDDSTGRAALANNLVGNSYDPKFADVSAFDFRLTTGSPAIDAGASVSDLLTDLSGIARPKGRGYDIGAYEY